MPAGKKTTGRRSAGTRASSTPAKTRAGAKRSAAKPAAKRPAPKKAVKKAVRKATPKKATKKATKKAPPKKKKAVPKKATAKKAVPKKTAPAKKAPAAVKAPSAPATKKAPPAKAAPVAKTKQVTTLTASPPATKGRGGKKTIICPLSGFEVTPAPPNLSPKTLDRLRQKLLDEKTRLRHQAEELTAEAEQLAREREAGDTQFDEESGEGDTVNIERERDLLLSATARQVIEEIDDALDRIKKGKYGVCKPAGRRISLERLEAIPWAQVCVDCKARAERRR
jgi:RNA polymerase-binding protein DksA